MCRIVVSCMLAAVPLYGIADCNSVELSPFSSLVDGEMRLMWVGELKGFSTAPGIFGVSNDLWGSRPRPTHLLCY